MQGRTKQACVDCGKLVPPAGEDSTLVSVKHGWRLVRKQNEDGETLIEWRCPTCWSRYRTTTRKESA